MARFQRTKVTVRYRLATVVTAAVLAGIGVLLKPHVSLSALVPAEPGAATEHPAAASVARAGGAVRNEPGPPEAHGRMDEQPATAGSRDDAPPDEAAITFGRDHASPALDPRLMPRPYTMRQWRDAIREIGLDGDRLASFLAAMDEFDRRWAAFRIEDYEALRLLRTRTKRARLEGTSLEPEVWRRFRQLSDRRPKVEAYQFAIWKALDGHERTALALELERLRKSRDDRWDGGSELHPARAVDDRVKLRQ